MRLDKLLAHCGYGSRKEIKALLKKQTVTIDDKRIKDGKQQVDPETESVAVDGKEVHYQAYYYWMLHKPAGVISATEDAHTRTVLDLLAPDDRLLSPFPVGRLDKDTEGLLLLTNDGELAHQLLSPKHHVDKRYLARVAGGQVTLETIQQFADGLTLLDGYQAMPARLAVLKQTEAENEVEIIIQEGKFHQVKRMFEAVGMKVTYLKRLQMGSLQLDANLPLGAYRPLTAEELAALKGMS
ncbi:pseudouridine synthase [Listeria costaricensis]|uniref:pseudouridine synthase n=1 Tax=Listeria costaricensis TaxID=2026604 RepID=UPI000C07B097|nr:pseudouridine synthase [Listeria costaricensis]